VKKDWELAPTRCPRCDAGLQGERIRRLVSDGGIWALIGREHWIVRCPNGHVGEGDTLHAAIEGVSRHQKD
jgi:hypothetical protein